MNDSKQPMRIWLADPQVLSRKGLALLLTKEGFQVVGESSKPDEINQDEVAKSSEILIVAESLLPLASNPKSNGIKTLVLCDSNKSNKFENIGTKIYRDSEPESVTRAIRSLVKDGNWQFSRAMHSKTRTYRLTEREIDVAKLISQGLNNREVAQKLEITEQSVKNLVSKIFKKYGLRSRVQLALKMQEVHD